MASAVPRYPFRTGGQIPPRDLRKMLRSMADHLLFAVQNEQITSPTKRVVFADAIMERIVHNAITSTLNNN